MTRTDLFKGILAGALTLLALLGLALLAAGGQGSPATPHPEFAPMLQGAEDGGGVPAWVGVAAGLVTIVLFGLAAAVGVKPAARRLRRAIAIWTVAYGLVFFALMRSWARYAAGDVTFFGGFPSPTAWVVYGLGLFPWILMGFFLLWFDEACYSEADQRAFEEILRRSGRSADED